MDETVKSLQGFRVDCLILHQWHCIHIFDACCILLFRSQHIQPPPTLHTAPVTKEASELSRNAMTLAISIGSA
jgi:hypothetical protein